MLNAEEIAAFEERARKGEKPVMEWLDWPTHGEKEISVLAFLHDTNIRVYWPTNKKNSFMDTSVFFMCFGVEDRGQRHFRSGDFPSLISAQLAAEHLLRLATAPLHPKGADTNG